MRFVVTGEWTKNRLLKLIVVFFLIYILAFWMTNFLLYFHKMDLTYQAVVEYYLGSEERFLQPRSYQGMLEVSHYHLFAMGFLMLTLTHLLLFVPLKPSTKAFFIFLCFGSAFLEEAANWCIRFVHPSFAYMKIGAFIALQISIPAVIIATVYALVTDARSAYRDTEPTRSEKG